MHAQAGLELSPDTEKAGNEGFWRFVLGRSFVQNDWGRTWSPMVEFLAAKELEEDSKVDWDLLPQLQVTLSARQHITLNVGVRLPVTDASQKQTSLWFCLFWDCACVPLNEYRPIAGIAIAVFKKSRRFGCMDCSIFEPSYLYVQTMCHFLGKLFCIFLCSVSVLY